MQRQRDEDTHLRDHKADSSEPYSHGKEVVEATKENMLLESSCMQRL